MLRKASDVFLDILRQYEVEYIYGIPGATEVAFMDALEQTPEIQYILSLNELTCVSMAETYGRIQKKPAVLNLHTLPGMAAAMAMLVNCKFGHVPMVVTVGQNDSRFLQGEPQLAGDITGMGGSAAKYAVEVTQAQELPMVLHRAFKTAMQPPMGPVVVSIPCNLLKEEIDYEPKPVRLPAARCRGDAEEVQRAAELIQRAKNPVMLLGEGVEISGAQREAVRLAEMTGSRVYQIWMADVNIPFQHPLNCGDFDSSGKSAQEILAAADLLIDVGGSLFNSAFYTGLEVIHQDLKLVHINSDPWEVGKNFITDAGIVGDPKAVLQELCTLLEGDAALADAAAKRTAAITAETDRKKASLAVRAEAEAGQTPIAISHLMTALRDALPENALVLDDSWSSSGLLRSILDLKEPGTYCRARNGGSIGFGIGGAMGMKQAAPDRPVVAVSGDGSAAWGMQGLWTAAHYNIPVTYIITNNAAYRQVKLVRRIFSGDYPLNEPHLGMEIGDPVIDFAMLAQSMGVSAVRVDDPARLREAIEAGIASGKPNLIDVYVENAPT